jgi:tRNA(Leu) C34 or U34 (ribose-2'-O)-methylase TrmL
MRGYFGIGVEGISKPYNVGNLFRSAHAFGASFVFTVDAQYTRRKGARIDTSDSLGQLPFYSFPDVNSMVLPNSCKLVGIELTEDSIELPSFQHPINAAYILGPERSSLSPEMMERCDFTVKIPTKFCLNVGIAGVVAMYDRLLTRGRFDPRSVMTGAPKEKLEKPFFGKPIIRTKPFYDDNGDMHRYIEEPPLAEVKIAEEGLKKKG